MDREGTVREAGLHLALEGWEDLDKLRMTNKAYQVGRMWAKTLEVEAGARASMVSWKNSWQPGLARRVLLSSGENSWRGKFNYEDARVRQMALNLMSPWRCIRWSTCCHCFLGSFPWLRLWSLLHFHFKVRMFFLIQGKHWLIRFQRARSWSWNSKECPEQWHDPRHSEVTGPQHPQCDLSQQSSKFTGVKEQLHLGLSLTTEAWLAFSSLNLRACCWSCLTVIDASCSELNLLHP